MQNRRPIASYGPPPAAIDCEYSDGRKLSYLLSEMSSPKGELSKGQLWQRFTRIGDWQLLLVTELEESEKIVMEIVGFGSEQAFAVQGSEEVSVIVYDVPEGKIGSLGDSVKLTCRYRSTMR
jgi:hypothetical protein